MQINIDTGTVSRDELTALIALCASLGGRLPDIVPPMPELKMRGHSAPIFVVDEAAPESAESVDPAVKAERMAPLAPIASEELLAQEAARVAEPASDPKQLDADGIPWDERIHSGNPTLTADGRWRKKRGVSEVYYGQIHAELSGTGITSSETAQNGSPTAETQAAPPPPVSPVPTAPPVEPSVPNAPATPTVAPPAPTAAPSASVESAPVATDGAGRWPDYATFVQAVSAIRQPTIPYAELNDMAQALGLVKFIDLRERADLWAQFYGMAGGQ